jgi:hypothetical protein
MAQDQFLIFAQEFLILIIIIALPLLPSIALYRVALDAKLGVTGPLAGLTINATGAFAAYVLVLAVCFMIAGPILSGLEKSRTAEMDRYSVWDAHGSVELTDASGNKISDESLIESARIDTTYFDIHQEGFRLKMFQFTGNDWQIASISIKDFGATRIELPTSLTLENTNDYKIDREHHVIHMQKPIRIRKRLAVTSKNSVSEQYLRGN